MSYPVSPVAIQTSADLAQFQLASHVRQAYDEMNAYFQAVCMELNPDSSKWKKIFSTWLDEDQTMHRISFMKKKKLCQLFLARRDAYYALVETFLVKLNINVNLSKREAVTADSLGLLFHTKPVAETLVFSSSMSRVQFAWLLHSPLAKATKTFVLHHAYTQIAEDILTRVFQHCTFIENIFLEGHVSRFSRNAAESAKILKCLSQRTVPLQELQLKNVNVDIDVECCQHFIEIMSKHCPPALHLGLSITDNLTNLPQFEACLQGATQLRRLALNPTTFLLQLLSPSVEHLRWLCVSPGIEDALKKIIHGNNNYNLTVVSLPQNPDGGLQLTHLIRGPKLLCFKYLDRSGETVHIEYVRSNLERKWHQELTEWTIAMMPLELPAYILLYILQFDVLPPFAFDLPAVAMSDKKTIDLLSGLCRARQKVFDQRNEK